MAGNWRDDARRYHAWLWIVDDGVVRRDALLLEMAEQVSDCVYHAYVVHLEALGLEPGRWEHARFRFLREIVDHNGPTHGSVAPWIISRLARSHGLKVRVQTGNYWTKKHWIEAARTKIGRAVACKTDYEYSQQLMLEPAIYLLYGSQHAVFSTGVPLTSYPIMAIQMYKEE